MSGDLLLPYCMLSYALSFYVAASPELRHADNITHVAVYKDACSVGESISLHTSLDAGCCMASVGTGSVGLHV